MKIETFIIIISAFIFGFIARKTGICLVAAVMEIKKAQNLNRLMSILSASIWGIFALWILGYFNQAVFAIHYPIHYLTFIGGFLFGIGASFNMGCNIATLHKLCRGYLPMLGTILGWVIGDILLFYLPFFKSVSGQKINVISLIPQNFISMILAISWLFIWWFIWQKGNDSQQSLLHKINAPTYRGMTGAIIIGCLTAILTLYIANWSPTHQLFQITTGFLNKSAKDTINLFYLLPTIALLSGMFFASIHAKNFKIENASLINWLRHIMAGILMGLGASMIPGGNDAIIFIAFPILSPHAPIALLSMLGGIGCGLMIIMRYGLDQKMNCQ